METSYAETKAAFNALNRIYAPFDFSYEIRHSQPVLRWCYRADLDFACKRKWKTLFVVCLLCLSFFFIYFYFFFSKSTSCYLNTFCLSKTNQNENDRINNYSMPVRMDKLFEFLVWKMHWYCEKIIKNVWGRSDSKRNSVQCHLNLVPHIVWHL